MAKIAKVAACIRTDLQDMKVVEAARKVNVKNVRHIFKILVYIYNLYIY